MIEPSGITDNKQLDDLVLCLVSALGLKDYIGRIYFYPLTHTE